MAAVQNKDSNQQLLSHGQVPQLTESSSYWGSYDHLKNQYSSTIANNCPIQGIDHHHAIRLYVHCVNRLATQPPEMDEDDYADDNDDEEDFSTPREASSSPLRTLGQTPSVV